MIKLFIPAEVKGIIKEEGKEDIYEIMISSGEPDRVGDIVNPTGWYLDNYLKNPVVLWAHQSGGIGGAAIPPVGKAIKVWVKDDKELWMQQVFAPTPFAQELKQLVDNGFLRAMMSFTSGNLEIIRKRNLIYL